MAVIEQKILQKLGKGEATATEVRELIDQLEKQAWALEQKTPEQAAKWLEGIESLHNLPSRVEAKCEALVSQFAHDMRQTLEAYIEEITYEAMQADDADDANVPDVYEAVERILSSVDWSDELTNVG